MVYGIRPSPTSCCWDCKYYDVESRYCSNLETKTSRFGLCPDKIGVLENEANERKKVMIRIYGDDFDEYDEEIKKRYEEVK
jgi:hypothetical protein